MLEPRPAEEWHGIDADLFEKTIRTRGRPAVLRGFAGSWPAVQAGRESFHSLTAYLKSFYTGHPAPLFEGPASIGGRFFYNDTLDGFNFESKRASLGDVLDRLCHGVGKVAPATFTELLTRLDRDYELPPLFITENGAAYRDLVIDGHVRDEERRAYIESHIRAIADAIDQGVDVRGYFVWSLLDNFEWAAGYTKRFGIYYVDYQTQARILKRSGFWYKDLAAAFNRTRAGARVPQGQV